MLFIKIKLLSIYFLKILPLRSQRLCGELLRKKEKQGDTVPEEKVRKRKGIVHINHEFCKRCGICVNFCPVKNLEIQHQTLMELERCIACKMCQRYCPDFAIEIEELDAKAVITG